MYIPLWILVLAVLLIPGALDVVGGIVIIGGLLLVAIYLLSRPEMPLVVLAILCAMPVIVAADKIYDWRDARGKPRKAPLPKLPPEPWEIEEEKRWRGQP